MNSGNRTIKQSGTADITMPVPFAIVCEECGELEICDAVGGGIEAHFEDNKITLNYCGPVTV